MYIYIIKTGLIVQIPDKIVSYHAWTLNFVVQEPCQSRIILIMAWMDLGFAKGYSEKN